MIEVAVYNQQGKKAGSLSVDESRLGGRVRYDLLKQAIVAYRSSARQGTASTRSRSMVKGSTRKLFRQKGTGRARMGAVRTPIRRGGGVTFAKASRDFSKKLNKKSRRLARNSALLAKLLSEDVIILESLTYDRPKTKPFAQLLGKLGVDRSCLVATEGPDRNVYLSARNVARLSVCEAAQLNVYNLLSHKKLVIARQAFQTLLGAGDQA